MTVAPSPPSLTAEALTVERDGNLVLDNVSFAAGPGCLMGVVGPNGAGKSTLFNVIVSLLPPLPAASSSMAGPSARPATWWPTFPSTSGSTGVSP